VRIAPMGRRSALACLGIAIPSWVAFNYIYRFGVDVPFWDQWQLIPYLEDWANGTLSVAKLFAQHNEHRIFFPRLVMIILAQLSNWNTRVEMFAGWAVVLIGVATLLWEHLKTFGRSPTNLWLFVPMAWLLFSLRQEDNWLWGWQITIFIAGAATSVGLVLLDSSERQPVRFTLALACAIVSGYSFGGGMGAWPGGTALIGWKLFIVRKRQERRFLAIQLAIWVSAGALATALYAIGFTRPGAPPRLRFSDDPAFFIRLVLGTFGAPLTSSPDLLGAEAVGLIIVLLLLGTLVLAARGRVELEKCSLAAGLFVFALSTQAMVLFSRSGWGMAAVTASRYTTLFALGTYAVYRVVLAVRDRELRTIGVSVVTVLITIGSYQMLATEYAAGRMIREARQSIRERVVNERDYTNHDLTVAFADGEMVRDRIGTLRKLRISVFRDPDESLLVMLIAIATGRTDTAVQARLMKQLAVDPETARLTATVVKGIARISGEIGNKMQQDRAIEIARAVRGVKAIESGMHISDPALAEAVKKAIAADPSVATVPLRLEVHEGQVKLFSDQTNADQRARLAQVTRAVFGVTGFEDNMK